MSTSRRPARRMAGRPMRLPRTRAEALGSVEAEMAAERANSLTRITAALADAVAQWRHLADRADVPLDALDDAIDQVSRAAWHLVVQRESVGLAGDHLAWVQDAHDVPSEAVARMGTRRVLVDGPTARRLGARQEGIPSTRGHTLWSHRGGG